eukprot:scaffold173069_cov29-Tisochrysis_lutea.AAC.1
MSTKRISESAVVCPAVVGASGDWVKVEINASRKWERSMHVRSHSLVGGASVVCSTMMGNRGNAEPSCKMRQGWDSGATARRRRKGEGGRFTMSTTALATWVASPSGAAAACAPLQCIAHVASAVPLSVALATFSLQLFPFSPPLEPSSATAPPSPDAACPASHSDAACPASHALGTALPIPVVSLAAAPASPSAALTDVGTRISVSWLSPRVKTPGGSGSNWIASIPIPIPSISSYCAPVA